MQHHLRISAGRHRISAAATKNHRLQWEASISAGHQLVWSPTTRHSGPCLRGRASANSKASPVTQASSWLPLSRHDSPSLRCETEAGRSASKLPAMRSQAVTEMDGGRVIELHSVSHSESGKDPCSNQEQKHCFRCESGKGQHQRHTGRGPVQGLA